MILQLKITWILLAVPGVALTILALHNAAKTRSQQRAEQINGIQKLTVDGEYANHWMILVAHLVCIVGVLMFVPQVDRLQHSPEWNWIAIRNTLFPVVSFIIGLVSLNCIRTRNKQIDVIRSEESGKPH